MKLVEVVKGLVHAFWHDNIRPSSNTRDVLKHFKGSRNNEPSIKHYLDMTQSKLYEMFKVSHLELRLGQRYFQNVNHGMLESTPSVMPVIVYTM
jgi:hypothetical protein